MVLLFVRELSMRNWRTSTISLVALLYYSSVPFCLIRSNSLWGAVILPFFLKFSFSLWFCLPVFRLKCFPMCKSVAICFLCGSYPWGIGGWFSRAFSWGSTDNRMLHCRFAVWSYKVILHGCLCWSKPIQNAEEVIYWTCYIFTLFARTWVCPVFGILATFWILKLRVQQRAETLFR